MASEDVCRMSARLGPGVTMAMACRIPQVRARCGRPAYAWATAVETGWDHNPPQDARRHDKRPSHPSNVTTAVYALSAYAPYGERGSDDAQDWPLQPSCWTRYAAPWRKRPSK